MTRKTPRLIMLARVPELGLVKSRLGRHVGEPQALRAHVQLLQHNAHIAAASGLPFELHYAGDHQGPFFAALSQATDALLVPQVAGDIGARMLAAASLQLCPSLIIGSDCGGLSVRYLRAAAAALDRSDVVLGPAEDGGYVLVGQQQPQPVLFGNVDWGTARVAEQTRKLAAGAGISISELPMQWDVDNVEDWRRYLGNHR